MYSQPDNFVVLRQCQRVQLRLLKTLKKVCEQNDLQFVLMFGSLIGALRHKGFIPWDDDLDVAMPITDCEKLVKLSAAEKLPGDVVLQFGRVNKGHAFPIMRLRDRASLYCEDSTNIREPSGIFVDIYPLDKVVDLPMQIGAFLYRIISAAWSSACVYRTTSYPDYFSMGAGWVKGAIWTLAYQCFKMPFVLCKPFLSKSLRFAPGQATVYYQHNDSDFFPAKKVIFENEEFPIPNEYERILGFYYGDWRKLPPVDERNPDKKMKLILPDRAPKVWWAVK